MRIVISEARHRQVIGVSYIIVMYCIIFCGRTVWSVTYILDKNYLQHLMNQWISNGNATNYYASMLCFYLVFEVRTSRWLRVGLRLWARLLAPRRCPLSAMVCVIARASRLCSFERTAADHTTLVHFLGGWWWLLVAYADPADELFAPVFLDLVASCPAQPEDAP